jgi:tetratricopeptide (TPR) repeat protein
MLFSVLCAICASSTPAIADDLPDAAVVRKMIDGQISSFQTQKKKATLGLVQNTIALSISYGAPAYNNGDHAGCYYFYAATADALVAAFPDASSATEVAHRAIGDLKAASDRAKQSKDADRNAWAMRYAFDKTQLEWEVEVESITGLMRLGTENFQKSQFEEAQDAYESAGRGLLEFDGQPLAVIPPDCRFAPLALANALFAQKQYKLAADAVTEGLRFLPEWRVAKLDLRSLHHDTAEYEALIDDLQTKVKAAPDDASLQFLLGYEYFFTGKKAAAKEQFEKTLKLDPQNAGAEQLLHPEKNPAPDSAPLPPTETKPTVKA